MASLIETLIVLIHISIDCVVIKKIQSMRACWICQKIKLQLLYMVM